MITDNEMTEIKKELLKKNPHATKWIEQVMLDKDHTYPECHSGTYQVFNPHSTMRITRAAVLNAIAQSVPEIQMVYNWLQMRISEGERDGMDRKGTAGMAESKKKR